MEEIKKKIISELPEATTIENLYTLGTDKNDNSVKVPINLLKGNKGDKGDAPFVGTNNNWWVGTADTGVPSVIAVSQETGQDTVKAPSLKLFTDEIGKNQQMVLNIKGINYTSNLEVFEYNNLVPSYSNIVDYFLDANGVEQKARFTDQISYNQIYVPVQPNVTYMCNSVKAQDDQRFIFYDANKTFIGSSFGTRTTVWGGIFTTPANCAFVRYNYMPNIGKNSQIYIYPSPESNVIKKLAVDLGVEDMRGAFEVEVESNSGNILPATLNMGNGFLNNWNAVSSGDYKYTIDYLPIEPGIEYTTNLVNLNPMFLFYDSEKRFITNNGVASNSSPFGDFTTPINCAYIRFNGRTSIFDGFYIKKKNAGKNIVIPNLYIPVSNVIDDANPVEKLDYYACGDSLTEGANSWAVKMAAKFGMPFTNLAIGGKMAMGDDGLILQINQIPTDFKGLVTIMIGTNDCWQRRTVGDANTTLSKAFDSLTLTDNFSDAYRKCMETLVRKVPEARIVCMTPAPTNLANIEQYREVERIICKWLSIPIYDVYNEIGIFSGNLNVYAPVDGVHITESAHIKIARVFGNRVKALL
ncbi:MAG: SGNH/GDSL hydrolase family protein [Prevotella sp.]|jgi:hypothetical protein|nr:SGNH/GDSL hydrolase family protein [Prevotella sp.]